ncbi:hypothetical protein QQF64_014276 [Cirrhinus molitorella]|uniref:Uncharacterized protein n=1 Tax=Cirrhinus molitorella TaxID=172907 RepID=A0ABR3NSB7_9TELE
MCHCISFCSAIGNDICSLQYHQLTVGGISRSESEQVFPNQSSSGVIRHFTEQEQDIRAADAHEADVLHSCAALCRQEPKSIINRLSEITTHKAMLCNAAFLRLQKTNERQSSRVWPEVM